MGGSVGDCPARAQDRLANLCISIARPDRRASPNKFVTLRNGIACEILRLICVLCIKKYLLYYRGAGGVCGLLSRA